MADEGAGRLQSAAKMCVTIIASSNQGVCLLELANALQSASGSAWTHTEKERESGTWACSASGLS